MADVVEIGPITDAASDHALEALFAALYTHLEAAAGRRLLRDDGYEHWIARYDKVAGRSRVLIGAWDAGRLIGFLDALLRAAPAHQIEPVSGFIAHLYVDPAYRERAVATRLTDAAGAWFRDRNVTTIELQVVAGNEAAHLYWRRLGFEADNVQYRKML
ncbi:GNAT family N-acetyltransferase [Sphingomonas sp. TZW2008]|uniref:GNAT family N-acetyltransferase n=1 Tax=Sphingomonas sp. TZW2008 TaxID=1917973 RepID=UPI000A2707D0|nr:GNAT family N-acetyltransferase [Sphingomonas sp. TZW2008]